MEVGLRNVSQEHNLICATLATQSENIIAIIAN